ncbi:unnamed protein product [Arctia plantaginis]|uniref:C-type lectin domain-containing protein n=1 Tax=Arctia plantaginis TaxID=874455 RepID=A0A8S0ZGA5_ARCPL|nr:unnamed protein product [Arctia plantaginis]
MLNIIACVVLLSSVSGGAECRAASDQTKQNCEQNGYEQYDTGCYKLHDRLVTWDAAKASCAAEGAFLVIINDKTEAEIVSDITKDSSYSYDWVGLRDESGNGDWHSVRGDRINNLYNIWVESDPQKYKCGALKYSGKLDDVPCTNEYSFVCEK